MESKTPEAPMPSAADPSANEPSATGPGPAAPPARPTLGGIGGARRRAVSVSQQDMVRRAPLSAGGKLPLVLTPAVPGVDLAGWAEGHREEIRRDLREHGGLLFRGFNLPDVDAFQGVVRAIAGELLEYRERSSPRHAVAGRVYTSTDYPPDQPIFLHNENSYQQTWPMQIFFYCDLEAATGGETPIADVRRLYQRIDPAVRGRFEEKGWMYVRNFGDGFGLPWQTVFQTDDRARVEEYCAGNGIRVEWKDGGRLRTRAVRPAAVPHPVTGEMVWFNHATFFHVTTLTETVRASLLAEFGEEDLPTNTYYGDGSPIEPEALEHLRALYHEETVAFPWQRGDLLMLDNMMVAHGRAPFTGQRKVLVGMAEPCSWETLAR